MLLTSGIFLFFSFMQHKSFPVDTKLYKSLKCVQTKLLQKETLLQNQVNSLAIKVPSFLTSSFLKNNSDAESFENTGNAFYVFKDSNLVYWSTNRIPVPPILDSSLFSKSLVQLLNGWYLKSSKTNGKYTVIGLSLVKNNFLYENVYLENSFAQDYGVDPSIQLQLVKNSYNVFDSQKRFLFSLYIDEDKVNTDYSVLLTILLMFFAFLFFIYGLYSFFNSTYPNCLALNSIYFVIVSIFLVGIRIISVGYHFPQIFYQSKLFSPIYYASSKWLPSLGDLLLNTMVLILVIWFMKKAIQLYPKTILKNRWIKSSVAFVLMLVQFFTFSALIYLIRSIVFNSSISFNNDSIFNYTYIHYLVFVIIGMWILTFVEISYHFLYKAYRLLSKKIIFGILFTLLLVLFTFVNRSFINTYNQLLFFFISYYVIIAFILFKRVFLQNVWVKLGLLLLFSVFVTQALDSLYSIKERDERLLLAEKLGTQHDPITEYRLDEVSSLISADRKVKEYARNLKKNETTLLDYLDRTYLNTFSAKYKVSVTICKQNQILKLQPDNYKIECALYFDKKIATVGTPTKFNRLWFMNYLPGQISYLLVIEVDHGDSERKENIYIELDSKMYVTDSGYPELLIDKKQRGINKDFSRYSYARYVNNDLVNQYGKYSYSVRLDYYKPYKNITKYFDYEGYNHLYYQFTDKETIILSKRISTTLEKSATVSYYFLLYGIILLVISVFHYNPMRLLRNKLSFQLRIDRKSVV